MRSAGGIDTLRSSRALSNLSESCCRLTVLSLQGVLTVLALHAVPRSSPCEWMWISSTSFSPCRIAKGVSSPDLNEGDFRVYEDGVEQKIAVFEKEDVESAIGILLDNSLSMVDILPRMKTGLLDFAEHTQSFNELFVMTFGTRVRTLHEVGQPLSQLESSLKTLGAQGTSVLFDALVEGLRKVAAREPERKALLVFTDGIDTASKSGFKDVLLEAQKAGALLYFIPIGSRILIDEHTIDSLAKETGGRVIYLQKTDRVPPAMETIRQELARQYYIGYYTSRKPGFHSIRRRSARTHYQDSRKDAATTAP